ncbi:MAG: nickel-dependent lactate racemase [Thermodesulfobacteriota bacterium]
MVERQFRLRYGQGEIAFELDEDLILYEILGRDRPGRPDVPAAYRRALDQPLDSPPLRELVRPGQKVALVVSDITRTWQNNSATLPILVEYLDQIGVRDEDLIVVIAVGNHRQNTTAEFEEICGPEVCWRVRVVNHQAWDDGNLVYYGRTTRGTEVYLNSLVAEADRVILTGGVVYHYMCGFGGGRKSVLPGVAGLKTIQRNHTLCLAPEVGGGTNPLCYSRHTRGNPMHEDMMEIAAFLKPDFLVNVVTNFANEVVKVAAGHWITAWQEACALVDEMCGVEIERKADIVIASTGGYPKDINLYQSQKTLDNACLAAKPGGAVILLAECPDIEEPREFFESCAFPDALTLEKSLRDNFVLPGWLALKQFEYCRRFKVILVTRPENFQHARTAHYHPAASLEEALELARRHCGRKKPGVTVMPFAANTCPIYTGPQPD